MFQQKKNLFLKIDSHTYPEFVESVKDKLFIDSNEHLLTLQNPESRDSWRSIAIIFKSPAPPSTDVAFRIDDDDDVDKRRRVTSPTPPLHSLESAFKLFLFLLLIIVSFVEWSFWSDWRNSWTDQHAANHGSGRPQQDCKGTSFVAGRPVFQPVGQTSDTQHTTGGRHQASATIHRRTGIHHPVYLLMLVWSPYFWRWRCAAAR